MLPLFICENNSVQRKNLEQTVKNYILMEKLNMELTLSTGNPLEILDYLHHHPNTLGLYFLDINLNHEMNGIALAAQIRELDLLGHIVFVTAHIELTSMIFSLKIEALDFILKSKEFQDIKDKITDCIDVAYKRYLGSQNAERQQFQANIGGKIQLFPFDDIMFFETSDAQRTVILHLKQEQKSFRYSLREVEAYSTSFLRCHRSYVVNLQNIEYVDTKKLEVRMKNGELCPLSANGMRKLKAMLE
ncbi:MAG: LytTR family DNA-binding domain-containing protein [Lachnospiraceae bacterium]|nr:LytTR family DNA-binding domain-containing protein [Lachnospiraceae bacterium]